MTRIPTLYPGEQIFTQGGDITEECVSWSGWVSTMREREGALMLITQSHSLIDGSRQCISCGAHQSLDGTLPCGH